MIVFVIFDGWHVSWGGGFDTFFRRLLSSAWSIHSDQVAAVVWGFAGQCG